MIVIVGNPVDGLTFHGPFETHDDAVDYAENYLRTTEPWCIGEIEAPEYPEGEIPKVDN